MGIKVFLETSGMIGYSQSKEMKVSVNSVAIKF